MRSVIGTLPQRISRLSSLKAGVPAAPSHSNTTISLSTIATPAAAMRSRPRRLRSGGRERHGVGDHRRVGSRGRAGRARSAARRHGSPCRRARPGGGRGLSRWARIAGSRAAEKASLGEDAARPRAGPGAGRCGRALAGTARSPRSAPPVVRRPRAGWRCGRWMASASGIAGASRAWMSTMNRTPVLGIEQHRRVLRALESWHGGDHWPSPIRPRERPGTFVDNWAAATTCTPTSQHVIGTFFLDPN